MGQKGSWDAQQIVSKLKNKKSVLTCLSVSIPWEAFRPFLKRVTVKSARAMLVLQQLFNLSDDEVEFQVDNRRSFEEFVGLGVMNDISDATTVAFFRERLRKANVIEWLLKCLRAT
jgi:transposase, IS5 family